LIYVAERFKELLIHRVVTLRQSELSELDASARKIFDPQDSSSSFSCFYDRHWSYSD